MADTLIVFVDSLPYQLLGRTSFLGGQAECWAVNPGFGYSVNIHAELFGGKLPDEIGYFGEWTFDPPNSPGWRIRRCLPLLDIVFNPYLLNRGLQSVLTRMYARGHVMPNIRLRDLDKFALVGRHIQAEDVNCGTLFSEFPSMRALSYRGTGMRKGERDAIMFEQGIAAIADCECLYVPLPDLDGFGHRYGIDGVPYRTHLGKVDQWCQCLSEAHRTAFPGGHVFIVSDHGMVNVTQGVALDIEARVGRASADSYVYFSDANLLRVWVQKPELVPAIREYLDQYPHGQIVDENERRVFGINSRKFGDFIYVLNESLAFQPSTFARNIPLGMHGYHPNTPSQAGICVHLGPAWGGAPPERMVDVYRMMRSALLGNW